MLRRKIMEKLLYWKDDKHKRALLVTGARQTGKTWIIRQFAREQYKHFLELNFLEDPNARDIFSGSLDANTIITALTAYTRASLVPHETPILVPLLSLTRRLSSLTRFRNAHKHGLPSSSSLKMDVLTILSPALFWVCEVVKPPHTR